MDVDNKLLELIYNQCFYHFCFDVTTGIVDMDIIDKSGLNHNEACGLSVPYKFDDLIKTLKAYTEKTGRRDAQQSGTG